MVTKMCVRVVFGCGGRVCRAGTAEQAVVRVAKNMKLEVFQKCFFCHDSRNAEMWQCSLIGAKIMGKRCGRAIGQSGVSPG